MWGGACLWAGPFCSMATRAQHLCQADTAAPDRKHVGRETQEYLRSLCAVRDSAVWSGVWTGPHRPTYSVTSFRSDPTTCLRGGPPGVSFRKVSRRTHYLKKKKKFYSFTHTQTYGTKSKRAVMGEAGGTAGPTPLPSHLGGSWGHRPTNSRSEASGWALAAPGPAAPIWG